MGRVSVAGAAVFSLVIDEDGFLRILGFRADVLIEVLLPAICSGNFGGGRHVFFTQLLAASSMSGLQQTVARFCHLPSSGYRCFQG